MSPREDGTVRRKEERKWGNKMYVNKGIEDGSLLYLIALFLVRL